MLQPHVYRATVFLAVGVQNNNYIAQVHLQQFIIIHIVQYVCVCGGGGVGGRKGKGKARYLTLSVKACHKIIRLLVKVNINNTYTTVADILPLHWGLRVGKLLPSSAVDNNYSIIF